DQTIVAQLVYHLFVDFPRTPDEQVSTRIVSMFSSPRLDRGLATRTWDAYGLETPSEERAVVAEGVWRETPHVVVCSNDEGTRFPDTTNLRLEPGALGYRELLRAAEGGVFVQGIARLDVGGDGMITLHAECARRIFDGALDRAIARPSIELSAADLWMTCAALGDLSTVQRVPIQLPSGLWTTVAAPLGRFEGLTIRSA